jgi:hypothetical protein
MRAVDKIRNNRGGVTRCPWNYASWSATEVYMN